MFLKVWQLKDPKLCLFKKIKYPHNFSINFETPHLVFGEERHLYMYLHKATQNNLSVTMVQE
jgi:hypothetical protein